MSESAERGLEEEREMRERRGRDAAREEDAGGCGGVLHPTCAQKGGAGGCGVQVEPGTAPGFVLGFHLLPIPAGADAARTEPKKRKGAGTVPVR